MSWRHFKITYDPSLDYEAICHRLFCSMHQWLCVLEKATTNPHVHFQGFTNHTADMFKNICSELFRDHWIRKQYPNKRPVRHSLKPVDEQGFQYLMKEAGAAASVLSKNNLTDEELQELHEASDAYVDDMKTGLRKHLHSLPYQPTDPVELHAYYRYEGQEYYLSQNKFFPPNFQKLILHAMAVREPPCKRLKMYTSERI